MPVDFKYVPASGPLAGRAFEEQTERAFNELGAQIDIGNGIAQEALTTANAANVTASNALIEAQDATATAQTA